MDIIDNNDATQTHFHELEHFPYIHYMVETRWRPIECPFINHKYMFCVFRIVWCCLFLRVCCVGFRLFFICKKKRVGWSKRSNERMFRWNRLKYRANNDGNIGSFFLVFFFFFFFFGESMCCQTIWIKIHLSCLMRVVVFQLIISFSRLRFLVFFVLSFIPFSALSLRFSFFASFTFFVISEGL